MLKIVKDALIFASGAAVGAGTVYLIIATKYEKQYQQFCLEYSTMTEEAPKSNEYSEKANKEEGPLPWEDLPEKDIFKNYGADTIPTKEGVALSDYDDIEEPEENDGANTDEDYPTEMAREEPYIITEDEYSTTKLYHGKGELYYFARDGIITDDEEDPMYDYEKYIGPDAVYELDKTQDSVYVRNEMLGEDYLIVYCDKTWISGHNHER